MQELKEESNKINHDEIRRRFLALQWAQKIKQYEPDYTKLYQCSFCPEVSSFWGHCPECGEEMLDMDAE